VAGDRTSTLRNAEKLVRQGRLDQAIAEYVRVVEDQPLDWSTANTLGDLYARVDEIDKAVEQFERIAESFFREGFFPKAGALYRKILKLKPDEERALSRAAEVAAQQGLLVDARGYLNAIVDRQRKRGDLIGAAETIVRLAALDPADYDQRVAGARARFDLLDASGAVAELKAVADELTEKNRPLEAIDALREAARIDPSDAAVTTQLAALLASRGDRPSIDEAYALVALLADAAVGRGDWGGAATVLEDFARLEPTHVLALLRLVEVAVDGGLDDVLGRAQAQLADAYLATGAAGEARHIAEDLALRDPLDAAHVDRWRRALELLGEHDPDAVIADRLRAQVDMANTDDGHVAAAAADVPTSESSLPPAIPPPDPVDGLPAPGSVAARSVPERVSPAAPAHHVEIDLSVALDDIRTLTPQPEAASELTGDLEDVFAQFREEARKRLAMDAASQDLQRGMALYRAGQFEGAAPALERAARLPRFRFEAGLTLGRMCRARGQTWAAIDWLERAAQAPAPSAEEGHRLLYELAGLLESAGEVARALAICLELQAEAGAYEDVVARAERLARVQAAG
jgi:tetratricopeptide (TPR) repeat protein